MCLRERRVQGPRAPTLRGGGARAVGSSGVAPSRERQRGSLRHAGAARQRRTLQPASQRSHDERCPSGSGWGSALSRAFARACARGRVGCGFGPARPLAREPRLVAVEAVERGLGHVPCSRQRYPYPAQGAVVGRGFGLASRRDSRRAPKLALEPSAVTVRMGSGSSVPEPMPESEASGARERTLAPRSRTRGGDQAVGGRARGSSWLQKSTSGAWSRPKGHGSSPLAPRSRGRAQRAKARRKPGRGGESRQHASSDTGGGLLVIPRARRASVGRARGREHSAMEGVLERCEPSSLTRRRPSRSRRPEAMGMRQRCRIRRGRTGASEVMSQARPAVEKTTGGRSGAEEPSIVAPPGLRWTAHVNGRGFGPGRGAFIRRDPSGDHVMVAAMAEAGGSPSSEAPPGWLIRQTVR